MKQGASYALPWTGDKWEVIRQDVPSIAVTHTVLALVPLETQETSGWDFYIHKELLPSCKWQGAGKHCSALCVCRAVGVYPRGGNAGTSLSPAHRGWQSPSLPSASPCCEVLSIHVRQVHAWAHSSWNQRSLFLCQQCSIEVSVCEARPASPIFCLSSQCNIRLVRWDTPFS